MSQPVDWVGCAWQLLGVAANDGDSDLATGGELAHRAFFAKPIFHGARFDSHTLPVDVLPEIAAFQEAVFQIAAALWRRDNPQRSHLPAHFEAGFRLTIEAIDQEAGCTGVVLGMLSLLAASPQMDLAPDEVPYAEYYYGGRDCLVQMAKTKSADIPLGTKGKKAISRVGSYLAPDEHMLIGATPEAREGALIDSEFGKSFSEAYAIPSVKTVTLEGFFDSRSSLNHTLGIIVKSHTVTCRVKEGDVGQWNQYLDHRVLVTGLGVVNDSGDILSIADIHKVALAEPAHLKIQFERLRRLEAGWKNPGSEPLNRSMLERFFVLLESYERSGLPRPSVYPTDEGEARAEWSHRPWELSITALPDEPVFLLEALNLESDQWIEEEYTVSTSNDLLDFLRPLLGVPDADR